MTLDAFGIIFDEKIRFCLSIDETRMYGLCLAEEWKKAKRLKKQ